MAVTPITSSKREKRTVYSVSFDWGGDNYRSKFVGVTSVRINVADVGNKFDALSKAWESVRALVSDVEPSKMNVESYEVCD
jgi:hypothetical protein